MKENILKYSLYFSGVICLGIFILVRLNNIPDNLVVDLENYGDLYRLNYVAAFKDPLPLKKLAFNQTIKHSDVNDADILIFGDSFFNYRRHKSVPEQLSDALDKKIFFKQSHFVDLTLTQLDYKTNKKKILIFEIAERGIPVMFGSHGKSAVKFNFDFFTKLDTTLFSEKYNERYRFLLERSKATNGIYSMLNTFNFNYFGTINRFTPEYTLNPSWLFYESTVNSKPGSYNYEYSESAIIEYANNIIEWRNNISKKYNLEIIMVFIPNKSSLYHSRLGKNTYNNFLPKLSSVLNGRGATNINLYDDFINSNEILYYPTDTHWNEKGERIAAEKLIEYIKHIN